MLRRTLILGVVVAIPILGWLSVPTLKRWVIPRSAFAVDRLRIGMGAGEVREVLGEPSVRYFGLWRYRGPGDDDMVDVVWQHNRSGAAPTVRGWVDGRTGAIVGLAGMLNEPPDASSRKRASKRPRAPKKKLTPKLQKNAQATSKKAKSKES